jgi:hypothetical protein
MVEIVANKRPVKLFRNQCLSSIGKPPLFWQRVASRFAKAAPWGRTDSYGPTNQDGVTVGRL